MYTPDNFFSFFLAYHTATLVVLVVFLLFLASFWVVHHFGPLPGVWPGPFLLVH